MKKILARLFRIVMEVIYIILAFGIVALGLVIWRLYSNPVSVQEFLPVLEEHLLPKGSQLKLNADAVILGTEFNGKDMFYLKMKNLNLNKPGHPVLHLDEVKISYSLWDIVRLNYIPNTIKIDSPSLLLTIGKEGNWYLYTDSVPESEADSQQSGVVIRQVDTGLMTNKILNEIDSIILSDATVFIDDQQLNQKMGLTNLNFEMEKERDSSFSAKMTAILNLQDRKTDITTEAQFDYLTRKLSFDIEFDDLFLQNPGRFIPAIQGADLVIDGHLKGIIDYGEGCPNLVSCFKGGSFKFTTVKSGTLNLPAPLTNEYHIKKATINGAISEGFSEIKIAKSKLELESGTATDLEITVDGIGSFLMGGNLKDVKTVLKADISSLPIEEVPAVWPVATGPDAHAWVKKNLSVGKVEYAKFTLYFTGDNLDDLYGEMPVKNIKVSYLGDLTPVSSFDGLVKLYPDKVLITGTKGFVNQLSLKHAQIDLTNLDKDVSRAHIVLDIAGPVRDAMELIAKKPLEYPQMFGLEPGKTAGQAVVSTDLDFPLIDDLNTSQVKVKIAAKITDATIPTGLDEYVLNKANFDLAVSNQNLTINGNGFLKTVPLSLKWVENFSATKPNDISSEYEFNIKTSSEGLSKIWADIPNYLNGPLAISGRVHKKVSKAATGEFDVDLNEAGLSIYPTTIQKDKNVPMSADVDFDIPAGDKAKELKIKLKGFLDQNKTKQADIDSRIIFNKGIEVYLNKWQVPQTDITGHLKWQTGRLFDLKLAGSSLDLSVKNPSVQKVENPEVKSTTAFSSINLDVDLKKLTLKEKYPLTNIKIKGQKADSFWNFLSASAMGSDPFNLNYQVSKTLLRAHSKNYGDLVKRLNITDQFLGGTLDIEAKQTSKGDFDGKIMVQKFNLKEPGFLIQAFTILGIVDAFRGQDLYFKQLIMPFKIEQKPEWLFTINEGYMSGNSLGVTFNGSLAPHTLNLTGSVIPAYMVNSLLGKIPLVGGLFRNGDGGGLVGVRYDITGVPGQPKIEFQTLSSFAPGILGKLFD